MKTDLRKYLSLNQRVGLFIHYLLIIVGFVFTIITIFDTLISDIPFNVFPFLILLMSYISLIYYGIRGYKNGVQSYKLAIIFDMITLILSIIPIIVFLSVSEGIIQIIQLILLIIFIKTFDNPKIANKAINIFLILSIIITILIYINGHGIRAFDGIPSLILSGTFALIYYLINKFK